MPDNIIIRTKGIPHIREVIDIEELTELFQSYSDITGMVTALLDLEGNVLIATNWQDSCTQFHRVSEVTRRRCHESDTALAGSLTKGDRYNVYRCRNGLVDVATPVMIDGHHLGNFFTGQFFFEQPDLAYFSKQAEAAGFEKDAYLKAIENVPIYDEATIKAHMKLLVRVAEMIGKAGAANLRAFEANRELEQHKKHLQTLVAERTEKLNESLQVAEKANLAKSRFLTNMSHELRTPLNAVLGYSEILSAKERDPGKKRYLDSINVAGKGLLNLINSVLDLSKIEMGKMPIQEEPMSLWSLVEEINAIFNRQAAEKDLLIESRIASGVPSVILFDEVKLRQILINLVGNAIKFTAEGSVEIDIQGAITNEVKGLASLKISVIDTGKGIRAEDQSNIFKAFEQAKDQKISEYGGTGLGLALSSQLVDVLGGTLKVESTPNKGSIFQCEFANIKVLPASSLTEKLANQYAPEMLKFSPSTILVVDDNAMNRDLMVTYLSEWDFRILVAENGKRAIEMAKKYNPDLIFMDMKMPVMDGYEATQWLKNQYETQHIPIVAATASVLSKDKVKIRELTDDYLSKPITYKALVGCLSQFIPQEVKSLTLNKSKRVLIVDDDKLNRFILSDILGDWERVEVTTVCSGFEAVELSCQTERPDLILMDCQMPGMNGVDAARKIREWEQSNQVASSKIVVVTAHSKGEMEEKDFETLFNGILTKPLKVAEVSRLLRGYL